MRFHIIFIVLFLAFSSWQARAAEKIDKMLGGIEVTIWMPAHSSSSHALPVIVFSHGFNGCNTQSQFLTEGLAQAGYMVLAPNHADARCKDESQNNKIGLRGKITDRAKEKLGESLPSRKGEGRSSQSATSSTPGFRFAQEWDDRAYAQRRDDIKNVIAAALQDETLGKLMDTSRIGLAGHSLGGYTVLGLAGAWPSWKDARFKAVLALSPFIEPYLLKGFLGGMNLPVMYQGGTRDYEITPAINKKDGAYDRSSVPKYYVEFDKAGHFAWTDLNDNHHAMMLKYSQLFFNTYLKAEKNPLLTKQTIGVSDLRSAP